MEPLKQAKELADQVLEMTKALVLTGEKSNEITEAESYFLLMDEREPLIDELTDLRQQLCEEELSSSEFAEIAKVITQITDIDKGHLKIMEHFHKNAKSSYRDVKMGQRINAGYNPLPGNEIPSKFDVRH